MKRILFPAIFAFFPLFLFSQIKNSYRIESFGSVATGVHTPFWTVNQNWGTVPLDADNFYLRGSIFREQILNEDCSFDAGLDIVGANTSVYGNPWIQQLYVRLNWKIWRLDIGQREDYISGMNGRLSSGDFVKSNNYRPIPEVKLSIPEYILVPYTQGNMYIKGHFAAGYYQDSRWKENTARPHNQNYTTQILSHHKSVYFRFGNIETKNRMQLTVEMDHVSQWGGKLHQYSQINGQWQYNEINQPQGIDCFFRVAIAKEGSSVASDADRAYVAGSQWGAYLFKWDYKLTDHDLLSVYTNHFFDDGSGMVFENYRDGLFGLEYGRKRKSWLSGAVFEYICTRQQSGPIHHNLGMDDEHREKLIKKGNGNDNYYNNVDYVHGPSYFGRTMGSPLLLSPMYNTDGSINFKSSRIIAFHIGLEGYCRPELQYRLLLTTGQGWGRYYLPFKTVKKGFASHVELIYAPARIEGCDIKLSAGYDKGELFGGNTFGGSITLCKRGYHK
jgi:hypothetical protein